jgi:hypothetical protein
MSDLTKAVLSHGLIIPEGGGITPPDDPDFTTVYGFVRNPLGEPVSALVFSFELTFGLAPNSGIITTYGPVTATTDEDGLFEITLRQGNYRLTCEAVKLNVSYTFTTPTRDLSFVI